MNRKSRKTSRSYAVYSSNGIETNNEHELHYNLTHNKSLTNVDASYLVESPANQTNRQYLGSVYDISTYSTEPLSAGSGNRPIQWELTPILTTTSNPIERIFMRPTKANGIYLRPSGLFTFADPSVGSADLLFEPIDTETYQLKRPPSHTNVPQFDDYSSPIDVLHRTHNVTRPHLLTTTGTNTGRPDTYDDFYETRAESTNGKVVEVNVTATTTSTEPTILHTNFTDKLMHSTNNPTQNKINATTTKDCLVRPNSENICGSNDLNIVIKLDTGSSPNAATPNDGKVRVKQKVRRVRTTTIVPYIKYEPYNYDDHNDDEEEDDDAQDEDYGISSYVEPIQNVFSLMPAYETRKKKKPMHMKKPHKHHDDDMVHKYQTIIVQTHAPPVTEAPPKKHIKEFSLHGLFYKLLAFMPFLAIKPIFFGFWTMVLSPILVIAISGVALAVTLYPWISISHDQVAYARLQSRRAPKIIVHRHPVRRPDRGPSVRLHTTKPFGRQERKPPFLRRRTLTSQPPFGQMREPSDNGSSRSKRFPLTQRANVMRHRRMNRHVRDTHFQEWLLVQNNFNVRILSPHKDRDHYY